MVLSGWNPAVLNKVALPACHIFAVFYTRELSKDERFNWLQNISNNKFDEYKTISNSLLDIENVPKYELSCSFTMRSNDFFLGNPINIVSYALLTHMFAQCANMTVGELVYHGMDVHLYENHIEQIKEQLGRDPHRYDLPKLELNKDVKNIFDFKFDDIKILNYESYPTIKAPLSVG